MFRFTRNTFSFKKFLDIVLYPSESEQIVKTVAYCAEHKIPLYVYGGGSSVTRGVEPVKGGVSLDMRRKFNKVLYFNEVDQTITVQAGLSGPDYENHLNNAVEEFGAKRAYTCGHFPQSFEYSSVGGWVVTRGSGQNSTYYGCAKDLVVSQKYATPRGEIVTSHYPREATGPNLNEIMSEMKCSQPLGRFLMALRLMISVAAARTVGNMRDSIFR